MSDDLNSLRQRSRDIQAAIQKIADKHLDVESSKRCFLHFIVHEEAKRFWEKYFPVDEGAPCPMFIVALSKEYPFISTTQIQRVQAALDIDGGGRIHAREFNIFTSQAGLPAPSTLLTVGLRRPPPPSLPRQSVTPRQRW